MFPKISVTFFFSNPGNHTSFCQALHRFYDSNINLDIQQLQDAFKNHKIQSNQMLSKRRKYSGYFEKMVMQILCYMQIFPQTLATYQNVSFSHDIDIHKHLFPSVAVQLQKFSGGIVRAKLLSPFHLEPTFACAFFWGLQYFPSIFLRFAVSCAKSVTRFHWLLNITIWRLLGYTL